MANRYRDRTAPWREEWFTEDDSVSQHAPKTVQELLGRYQSGDRRYSGVDFDDEQLQGCILSEAIFDDSWFCGANFDGADLRGASFRNCNLKCATFRGADVRNACFEGAALEASQWNNALLDGARFVGATHYGYTFVDGDLPPMD